MRPGNQRHASPKSKMVAIPVAYDQPGVAARIAHHHVGEFIELQDLTPEVLFVLIRKVLDDPSYRDSARFFREAIAAANGLEVACELIERAFGLECDARSSARSTSRPAAASRSSGSARLTASASAVATSPVRGRGLRRTHPI